MRIVTFGILAGLSLCGLSGAHAADLDFAALRGSTIDAPAPAGNWEGVYFGAHGGWSSTNFGFRNVFQPIISDYFRGYRYEQDLGASTFLQPTDVRRDGTSFGAYAGINFQFDEFVAGVEADYTHLGSTGRWTGDRGTIYTIASDGYFRALALDGQTSTRIDDYATVRARFGYDVGNFLPFVTGGLAIGSAQVTDKVSGYAYEYDQNQYKANLASSDPNKPTVNHGGYASFDNDNPNGSTPALRVLPGHSKEKVVGGIAAGAGLDFALTANILLRAEYQYVMFNDFDGHKSNINTVRGGAAVKF
jgi:outer membrane immunogenic protein